MSCGCREAMCPHVGMPEESINEVLLKTRKSHLDGMAMKYTVIKNNDIEKYLAPHQIDQLQSILDTILVGRTIESKKENIYVIVNTDEPYADQIIDTMKSNGHWG